MSGYTTERFGRDLVAGSVVGVVALPLAMAFAIASGVSPERGLYTAIVAGAAISIFGGSRHQIGGPTGAMVAVLSVIVIRYGLGNLLLASLVAGIMLVFLGVFRAGSLIRFIPFPVTAGFTTGIAVLIASGQINSFLGLTGLPVHEQFHLNLLETVRHLSQLNLHAVAVAGISTIALLMAPRLTSVIPGSLLGMALATLVASLASWPVETIGTRFGGIPRMLPPPALPPVSFSALLHVLSPAFTIAMLGAIESLLSCVVADARTGDRHDSNKELIGQGIANCLAPIFGGIPATGAIARTATNIRNGGNSPVSGVVHSVVLLLIMLIFAPWAGRIPLASMAPVLMGVAFHMAEVRQIRHVFKGARGDAAVLAVTLFLTVFADLTVAVAFGLLAAAVLFIKKVTDVQRIQPVLPDAGHPHQKVRILAPGEIGCPQITILTVDGALFFGAAPWFEEQVLRHSRTANTLMLRMGKVPLVDASGEKTMRSVVDHCRKSHVRLIVTGLQPQPERIFRDTGLLESIGPGNAFPRTGPAIDTALAKLDLDICGACPLSVFRECEGLRNRGLARRFHE